MSNPTIAIAVASGAANPSAASGRTGRCDVAHQPRQLAWPRRLAISIAVTDAAVIALALVVAQLVRFGVDGPGVAANSQDISYAVLGLVIGIVWIIALWAARSREHRIIGIGLREYQRVANATLGTFGVLAIVAFIARLDVARGYLAVALPTGLVLLLLGRVIWRNVLQSLRQPGDASPVRSSWDRRRMSHRPSPSSGGTCAPDIGRSRSS